MFSTGSGLILICSAWRTVAILVGDSHRPRQHRAFGPLRSVNVIVFPSGDQMGR